MLRIDSDTVGANHQAGLADELDPGRLNHLYDIAMDEVS
jgi:hypothetical protein